jgi:hypothetical protein
MDGMLISFQVLRSKDAPACNRKRTKPCAGSKTMRGVMAAMWANKTQRICVVDANIRDSFLLVQLRVGRAALKKGRSHQPGARPLSAIERRTPSPSLWF